MTKAQEALLRSYRRATATDLDEVYSHYSYNKKKAFNYCRRLQHELNGYDGRICSANTFQFSYAFQYRDEEGNPCLCYITKAQDWKFRIA